MPAPDTAITAIHHRTVFDSRGVETLEVDLHTPAGFSRMAAPFGAPGSRGEFEAPAYAPAGLAATRRLLDEEIIPRLIGLNAADQETGFHPGIFENPRQHAGRAGCAVRSGNSQYPAIF